MFAAKTPRLGEPRGCDQIRVQAMRAFVNMLIVHYPNNEVRVRIPAVPLKSRQGQGESPVRVSSSCLSIVAKLRSETEDPFRPIRSREGLRVGYGAKPRLTEFGPRARRKIARTGGLLSGEDSRKRTVFLTGTLPGGTEEALSAISCHSGWIVHELLTHIPRMAGVRAADCRFIWVWEWQERGALHWHGVFQFPSRRAAGMVFEGFVPLWIRILESVGRRAGIDIAARLHGGTNADDHSIWKNRAEWARKNPSRYLAKYVSKANKGGVFCENFPPSRWYGVSRSLHRELREAISFVTTSSITGMPEHKVSETVDLPIIERLFGWANSTRQFSDKVRDGYTFVFYVPDDKTDLVLGLIREVKNSQRKIAMAAISNFEHRFHYLSKVQGYPVLMERFLNDCGKRLREVFELCREGQECDFEDLVLLDKTAYQVLLFAGLASQVNSPKGAKRELTGQNADTLESGQPPNPECVQNSLIP